MASKTTHSRQPEHPASIDVGVMTPNSEAAIWTRLMQPERDDLSADAARSILRITFTEDDKKRMHELALKAQEGNLSESERVEIDNYCRVGRLLDLMHSKARLSLKKAAR